MKIINGKIPAQASVQTRAAISETQLWWVYFLLGNGGKGIQTKNIQTKTDCGDNQYEMHSSEVMMKQIHFRAKNETE